MEIITTTITANTSNMRLLHAFLRGRLQNKEFELLKNKDDYIVVAIDDGGAALMIQLDEDELLQVIKEATGEYQAKLVFDFDDSTLPTRSPIDTTTPTTPAPDPWVYTTSPTWLSDSASGSSTLSVSDISQLSTEDNIVTISNNYPIDVGIRERVIDSLVKEIRDNLEQSSEK